jgi:hypothetical protein
MYHLNSQDEWNSIHPEDLWVYNKLFLNHRLRHLCAPAGVPVPFSGYYVVRPSINLLGMGRFSRMEWIDESTDHLHPAEFWCEVFVGDHLSVDYHNQKSKLVVLGERNKQDPLYKWKKWTKLDTEVEFPSILNNLKNNYEWINCEFIGNHLIEVHFRRNPDFRYGNSVAIPVWNDENVEDISNFRFIEDRDYLRKGFYID